MNKSLSAYLELLRLLAATAVLLGHAQGYVLPIIPSFIAGHADEGVATFFVLSGFVIRYVLDEKERDWQSYFIARASRIFSVTLVALLVTYIVDSAGLAINPADYHAIPFYNPNYISALFRALTFTNEVWSEQSVFGSNQAYWSLGYEVQYYLVFGLIFFLSRPLGFFIALLWGLFVGPSISLYFVLWLVGVGLYDFLKTSFELSRAKAIFIFVFSIVLYFLVRLSPIHDYKSWITHGIRDYADLRTVFFAFLYYLAVGFAVSLNILSFKYIVRNSNRVVFNGPSTIIRWLAGGSFTVYLVHQPLLTFARAAVPGIRQSPMLGFAAFVVIVLICFGLAELGERRKSLYKQCFSTALKSAQRATTFAFANGRAEDQR